MKRFSIMLFILMIAGVAFAQVDDRAFNKFQFNFATPGARANAMGRAFLGLADDATAAQTNPAGLVYLIKPEVSFEYKYTQYSINRVGSTEDSGQNISSPSFVSVVLTGGSARFAFFRQEYLNYEETYSVGTILVPGTTLEIRPESATLDFLGENYGGAVAFQLSSKVFIGGSVKLNRLTADLLRRTTGTPPITASMTGTDSGVGFTGGVILKPTQKFSIGAIVEINPKLKFDYTITIKPQPTPITFNIPDRYGVGVAIAPSDTFTILADIVFVRYSQMSDDFVSVQFNRPAGQFQFDDATEFHVGAEKTFDFGDGRAFAARAGVFSNPNHSVQYTGPVVNDLEKALALFFSEPDQSETGFTFGGGFGSRNFQIDAAYLISDPFDEFSTSFVIRF